MYKLIIGNVRVTVLSDEINHDRAAALARQTINDAAKNNKLLSHIELSGDPHEIDVKTTERTGARASRKTLKQSMLDAIYSAAQEKLNPSSDFMTKDVWCDNDTGQEWHGQECVLIRDEILKKLEALLKEM